MCGTDRQLKLETANAGSGTSRNMSTVKGARSTHPRDFDETETMKRRGCKVADEKDDSEDAFENAVEDDDDFVRDNSEKLSFSCMTRPRRAHGPSKLTELLQREKVDAFSEKFSPLRERQLVERKTRQVTPSSVAQAFQIEKNILLENNIHKSHMTEDVENIGSDTSVWELGRQFQAW